MLEQLVDLDRQITLAINSLHCPASDKFWVFMSEISIWFPMYALILGLIYWRTGWKKGLIFTAALGLMVLCCDQGANFVKDTVGRIRPCNDELMLAAGLHKLTENGAFSFFSGHACNSFGVACCSLVAFRQDKRLRYRGYAAFIFTWAALVSASRIFVAAHFFGDVVCGAIAGTIISLCIAFTARYFCNKLD